MFISFLHAKLIKGKATTSILIYKIPKPLTTLKYNPVYFFILTVLGLLLSGLFSSCGKQGYSLVAVCSGFSCCGAWALGCKGLSSRSSLALEHRLSNCGTHSQLLRGMWDLPGSGIEPVSPELASRLFTIEPPGKPLKQ